MLRKRRLVTLSLFTLLLLSLVGVACWYFVLRDTGDPRLNQHVRNTPPVPIVFTSRTDPASFRAGASLGDYSNEGKAIRGYGQPQWQAREGRLRILTTSGKVRELTWEKKLPDGGTLIDVMSPSISPNGKTVYFAGRRTDADGGRFRIYSVGIDGSDLKQITGGANDTGCVRTPPLRFGENGEKLSDEQRKKIDFDDIDPTTLADGTLIFASSRQPDTGGRDRRATQIWIKELKGTPRSLTANRSNDRWPYIAADRSIIFSLWSYQPEVINAAGTELVRHNPPKAESTAPADRWFGANITPSGESFSQVLKVTQPVWRPRPLASGNIVFMTPDPTLGAPFSSSNENPESQRLLVAQGPQGYVDSAPSSLAVGSVLPEPVTSQLKWLSAHNEQNRPLSLATPSPLPPKQIVLAASPIKDGKPNDYGIYLAGTEDWSDKPDGPSTPITLLFNDPELIDAEPVAVYVRPIEAGLIRTPTSWPTDTVKEIPLSDGKMYKGEAAKLESRQLTSVAVAEFPGQKPKTGEGPIFPIFPSQSIKKIVFYVSHRDRFDDPEKSIVRGTLEKLHETPVIRNGDAFETAVPIGSPTLLVGVDGEGKIVQVESKSGSKFYAYAGDHVSGARPGGYTFCTGCHTGHTFGGNPIAEKRK